MMTRSPLKIRTRSKHDAFKMLSFLLLSFFVTFSQAETATKDVFKPLKPTESQQTADIYIASLLSQRHYLQQPIDKVLSAKVFKNYLDALDPQHLYFLQSDIDHFSKYKYTLDTAIIKGNLDPAFEMYNLYDQRLIARLKWLISELKKGVGQFDFNKQDSIEIDRKDDPWSKTHQALDKIWHKRLKAAVLELKLNDKSDKEIITNLTKRYKSQLHRVMQTRSEDAFSTYMNALTGVYDPHTAYFSPRTSENFNINMSLSLEGIGAVLQMDNDYTKVLRLVPAGPASKEGQLRPGDRIVGVGQGKDGPIVDIVGWRLDEVVDLIRGPKKSIVRLKVIPAGVKDTSQTVIIKIVRDKVKLEEQAAQSQILTIKRNGKKYKIGYIELPAFYADFEAMQRGDPNYKSTTRDVRKLIKKLKAQGIKGLILDLRNNGGGSLQEANMLTGLFIKSGPTVQIRTSKTKVSVMEDPDPKEVYTGPLVVLVNRMSASASEIFSGAIQDYNRGILLGTQTFGKGTVQSVHPINHGQLKLTQAKFYRISGASTQHRGVLPDIKIPGLIDKTQIGEDALPYPLPWDYIPAVKHDNYGITNQLIEKLRKLHNKRFTKLPEYKALIEERNFLIKERKQKRLSLNEHVRLIEKEKRDKFQLKLVNERRVAEGKSIFKSKEAWEKYIESQASKPNKVKKLGFVTKEAGNIILDEIHLKPSTTVTH
jgi:carboxyl-terminal processing protease